METHDFNKVYMQRKKHCLVQKGNNAVGYFQDVVELNLGPPNTNQKTSTA